MPVLKRKSIFSFWLNNRGETATGEQETEEEKIAREKKEAAAAAVVTDPVEPTIDWEAEDNPYKKRYGDSQSQVKPLVQELQNFAEYDQSTKTWKLKVTKTPDVSSENPFEGYDPEFVKTLEGYTKSQISSAIKKFSEESVSTQKYNSDTLDSRNRALEEFGSEYDFNKDGKMNAESPLYKMADGILNKKYVELNADGSFHKYSNVDAEYLATAEAFALLTKRGNSENPEKGKLKAINGPGSRAGGVKKSLSYEEYRALSDDEKDTYDSAQMGG